MILPSKELLSSVLGKEVKDIQHTIDVPNDIVFNNYSYSGPLRHTRAIDIHRVAHLCKEYIIRNNYSLHISHDTDGLDYRVIIYKRSVKEYFHENTESEAIFKAGEWILKETK